MSKEIVQSKVKVIFMRHLHYHDDGGTDALDSCFGNLFDIEVLLKDGTWSGLAKKFLIERRLDAPKRFTSSLVAHALNLQIVSLPKGTEWFYEGAPPKARIERVMSGVGGFFTQIGVQIRREDGTVGIYDSFVTPTMIEMVKFVDEHGQLA